MKTKTGASKLFEQGEREIETEREREKDPQEQKHAKSKSILGGDFRISNSINSLPVNDFHDLNVGIAVAIVVVATVFFGYVFEFNRSNDNGNQTQHIHLASSFEQVTHNEYGKKHITMKEVPGKIGAAIARHTG